MARPGVEVVHVGSACRDVVPEDPRGWRLGGGVTYASLTTARLGLRTAAIVGVDSTAATASELDMLREAGVDLLLVPLDEGPDLPQPRDARRDACRRPCRPGCRSRCRRCPSRGSPRRAGRWCRSPASCPTPGRTPIPRGCPPRRRVAGLPARAGGGGAGPPPATPAVGRSCAAPTSSGSAITTCRRRRPCPSCTASWVRAPTCSSPRAPTAGC